MTKNIGYSQLIFGYDTFYTNRNEKIKNHIILLLTLQ
jgi:hypothetical protein